MMFDVRLRYGTSAHEAYMHTKPYSFKHWDFVA